MRILITGASGFIGSALVERLLRAGHILRLAVRRPEHALQRWPGVEAFAIDFTQALHADAWDRALDHVDAVINTVGIIRETRGQPFQTVHVEAPTALFASAARCGVERVVQVSALGADAAAKSAYHLSKRAADEALMRLHGHAAIVQPSLVFGADGASARQFVRLAALAVTPLPGEGNQRMQPIHIDDLCDGLAALLVRPRMPACVAAVGPRCLSLRDYLQALRTLLGAGRARWLPLPMVVMRQLARLGNRWSRVPVDGDRLAMLERGNCADAAGITALLGRAPRDPRQFITPEEAPQLLRLARIDIGLTVLRWSIAAVWIASGIVSLGVWPIEDSLAMLSRCGLHGTTALAALYGAAALDIGFGIGTLLLRLPLRKRLYEAQIILVAAYTVVIGMFLPELLIHPFAPIVKNLPMLAALMLLRSSERP